MVQASAHGILPLYATRNDRLHLHEIFVADNRFDLLVSIFPRDYDDFNFKITYPRDLQIAKFVIQQRADRS